MTTKPKKVIFASTPLTSDPVSYDDFFPLKQEGQLNGLIHVSLSCWYIHVLAYTSTIETQNAESYTLSQNKFFLSVDEATAYKKELKESLKSYKGYKIVSYKFYPDIGETYIYPSISWLGPEKPKVYINGPKAEKESLNSFLKIKQGSF
jgi:hypothetical protein